MKEETLRKLMLACACMLAATALAGCGSDDSSRRRRRPTTTRRRPETETTTTEAAKPTVVSIVVVNGVPKDGIVRQTVNKGDRVVLVVKSDVADEIHLHGYDLCATSPPAERRGCRSPRRSPAASRSSSRVARSADRRADRQRMNFLAHGIGGVRDLPVPESFFFTTAAIVLVVSFVLLGLLWKRPLLEAHADGRRLPSSGQRRSSSRPRCGSSSRWSRWRSSS